MEICPRGKWPSVGSAGGLGVGGCRRPGLPPAVPLVYGAGAWLGLNYLQCVITLACLASPEQCQTPSYTIARLTYIITLHTELLTQGMADCHKLAEGATEFRWKEILKNLCNVPARIWQA